MPRDRIITAKGELAWFPILRSGKIKALVEDASKRDSHYGGKWSVLGDRLEVDSLEGGAWLGLTDDTVTDFELKTRMAAPNLGGNASIFFRQHGGGQRYYQLDLKCELQAIVISKTDNDRADRKTVIISAVNVELVPGRTYDLELAVRGESITTYFDGKLLNQVRDGDYTRGIVCLTAWKASTHYVEPCLRVY